MGVHFHLSARHAYEFTFSRKIIILCEIPIHMYSIFGPALDFKRINLFKIIKKKKQTISMDCAVHNMHKITRIMMHELYCLTFNL